MAAQFDAYFDRRPLAGSGSRTPMRWAGDLPTRIGKCGAARLASSPHGNEVFAIFRSALDDRLKAAGADVSPLGGGDLAADERPEPDEVFVPPGHELRTPADDIDRFAAALSRREKKRAPRRAPRSSSRCGRRSYAATLASTCLAFRWRRRCDRDLAGLHRLGDLADEIDVEEAVLEARAGHLDMVGELEAALEGARGDAAIEHLAPVLAVSSFFSPLTVRMFSFASMSRSSSPKPATARVTR